MPFVWQVSIVMIGSECLKRFINDLGIKKHIQLLEKLLQAIINRPFEFCVIPTNQDLTLQKH